MCINFTFSIYKLYIFKYIIKSSKRRTDMRTYFQSSKRLTIPLESAMHLETAITVLEELLTDLKKIKRSPYGAVTKISECHRIMFSANRELKESANGSDVINPTKAYKGAT